MIYHLNWLIVMGTIVLIGLLVLYTVLDLEEQRKRLDQRRKRG